MIKKIIIGVLLVTVIGATGTALAYQAANQDASNTGEVPEPLAANTVSGGNAAGQQGAQAGQNGAAQDPGFAASAPWQETGTITEISDNGFRFSLQNGEVVFIELGPADFWRSQGVDLQVGQTATVQGSITEGMIHAEKVSLQDGQVLQIRTETGQPLWSGGVSAGGSQNSGEPNPEMQAQVDEWITIEGSLLAFQGGNITMSTAEGEIIAFQTGQPRFFSEQGISFQVGDEIVVVGYYQDGQFMAGDITQTSTGLRVMLRDPNGRPLWAGPGNGKGNGGSGGAGNHQ